MNIKKYEEYYNEIGQLIWKIMPVNIKEYIFQYELFSTTESCKIFWFTECKKRESYNMNDFPEETVDKLILLFRKLNKIMSKDNNIWSHCEYILSKDGKFNINFAYIEENDSWANLYMKGISDLTKEEAEEYAIPLEIWEEKVRLKNAR